MIEIRKGIRLRGKNEDWRVINVSQNRVTVVDLTKASLNISQLLYSNIIKSIKSNDFYIFDENVIDLNNINFSKEAKEKFEKRKKAMNMMEQIFGPDYLEIKTRSSSRIINKIINECGMSAPTFWRVLGNYLKSGKKDYSLYDKSYFSKSQRRGSGGGRKLENGDSAFHRNEEDNTRMRKWMNKYLTATSKEYTLEYCYIKLQDEYRDSNGNLGEPGTYPSMRQFSYFINTYATPEQLEAKKTSMLEMRNNKRLLKGDVNEGVYGPMDLVEIDAHEVDVSLVSNNDHHLVVGRPIIYYMIDRETRMIVGFTASFDNNAVIAMNRVYECLIDPKSELLMRHPNAPKYAIPYGILPERVMTDNGSDFVSKEARRCARALGINFCFSPAGVASLKPIVERSFGTFEKMIDPMMHKAGLIKKRHDSDHHKKAVLTIDQFRIMAEDFVYFHNTTICEGIPYTKDMIDYGIKQTPCDTWRHCVENKGQHPRQIEDFDAFRIALYKHKKASITRYGILVDTMKYIDLRNRKLEEMCFLNEREKIEVAINPATVNYIYYFLDGVWSRAWLNPDLKSQASFINMSVAEAEAYRKKMAVQKREALQEKRNQKSEFYQKHEKTILDAKREHSGKENDTKHIKTAREKEKLIEQKKLGQKNIAADSNYDGNEKTNSNDLNKPLDENTVSDENTFIDKGPTLDDADDSTSFDDDYMKYMEDL